MHLPLPEPMISADEISGAVRDMGRRLTDKFRGRRLTIFYISHGALTFTADLIRNIDLPLKLESICASSYRNTTESSGEVGLCGGRRHEIEGREVLITDDILDTGRTVSVLKEYLRGLKPSGISTCFLLDKPSRRKVKLKADFRCFEIPDSFVVGYGMDFRGYYRNLPYVGVLPEEVRSQVPEF